MTSWSNWPRISSSVAVACLAIVSAQAQATRVPTARLSSAPRVDLPGEIDSSNPAVWSLVDGVQRLFVLSSWGGVPVRSAGSSIDSLQRERPADLCGRPERQLPRIGAIRSADNGQTWEDLGIVLDAPPGSAACDSAN